MITPTLRNNLTVGWDASPNPNHYYTEDPPGGLPGNPFLCARPFLSTYEATIHGGPYSGSTRSKFFDERCSSSSAFSVQVWLVTHRLPLLCCVRPRVDARLHHVVSCCSLTGTQDEGQFHLCASGLVPTLVSTTSSVVAP